MNNKVGKPLSINSFSSGFVMRVTKLVRSKYGALPPLTFVLLLSIGTAWSFEGRYQTHNLLNVSHETFANNPPLSTMADLCTPLLSSFTIIPSNAMDGNQRAVGQVAALGVILGVRFALEPKNDDLEHELSGQNAIIPSEKQASARDGHRSAQTVANYRQCLKKLALDSSVKQNDV